MENNIKELKKKLNDEIKKEDELERKTSRVTLDVNIFDNDIFLSKLSDSSQPCLSEEVKQFITDQTRKYRPKTSFNIVIHHKDMSKEQQNLFVQATKYSFFCEYKENKYEMNRNLISAITLTLIGVVALLVKVLISVYVKDAVFLEFIDIFAWVFVWAGVDLLFIERGIKSLKQKRYLNIINSKFEFVEMEKRLK